MIFPSFHLDFPWFSRRSKRRSKPFRDLFEAIFMLRAFLGAEVCHRSGGEPKGRFAFDRCFDDRASNQELYEQSAKRVAPFIAAISLSIYVCRYIL